MPNKTASGERIGAHPRAH